MQPYSFNAKKMCSHGCQKHCNMIDECLGWSISPEELCYLYFPEASGPVISKSLDGYTLTKGKSGGSVISKSTDPVSGGEDQKLHLDEKKTSCFSKEEAVDRLEFRMLVDSQPSFGPQALLNPYSQIWSNKKYQFFHGITSTLLGSTIMRT